MQQSVKTAFNNKKCRLLLIRKNLFRGLTTLKKEINEIYVLI